MTLEGQPRFYSFPRRWRNADRSITSAVRLVAAWIGVGGLTPAGAGTLAFDGRNCRHSSAKNDQTKIKGSSGSTRTTPTRRARSSGRSSAKAC